ncbi:MAG: glycine--tRNA ligase subunit beta [Candidatus Accumulibacter sp.]|jgi:glycyl-tRNA synthetase beta chain|nr:glycine--tRNA ligase subunit beta [Accumulibacter sp.]
MIASLLVEILTEELPPTALSRLGEAFRREVVGALERGGFVRRGGDAAYFATPRRLAVLVREVSDRAADRVVEEKLMPVSVGLDADGQPTAALKKKLEARGIALPPLPASASLADAAGFETRGDGKAETLFYKAQVAGARLDDLLGGIVADALGKLPIPKLMRWGAADDRAFVRPAHGLVLLFGERVVPGEALGLSSGNRTRGHRFLSKAGREGDLVVTCADDYAELLRREGKVIADFSERRERIAAQLTEKAKELDATVDLVGALLDEVTALVEWPIVYVGAFESEFLDVPHECLILTMQRNQKYFPLFNESRRLIDKFLIVSNMEVADPKYIVGGNARVVRPRLADARFFFDRDRRATLDSRVPQLENVVYHNRLGSLLDRVARLEALSGKIAVRLGAGQARVEAVMRAARLAKADLVTDMVGEFPELQGVMGRYYALYDGEDAETADAIEAHYLPRFSGDALPESFTARVLALADRLDALAGFFGIGQFPTGEKDPFSLRRAALGVLRILMETPLPLDLADLVADARAGFKEGVLTDPDATALPDFIYERLRGLLKDAGYASDVIDAVLASRPARVDSIPAKLSAVREFLRLPEALALGAANKRIGNILRKAGSEGEAALHRAPRPELFAEDAERALFARVEALSPAVAANVDAGDYTAALCALAGVFDDVNRFFDAVMVNADDPDVRMNRLSLLGALHGLLNAVADISRLGV